ncbi:hypothetical protein SNEBB_007547 [Seison nebaliae]|nr:hypothetical protein SNEBB_007547 [Seison nebaliae]
MEITSPEEMDASLFNYESLLKEFDKTISTDSESFYSDVDMELNTVDYISFDDVLNRHPSMKNSVPHLSDLEYEEQLKKLLNKSLNLSKKDSKLTISPTKSSCSLLLENELLMKNEKHSMSSNDLLKPIKIGNPSSQPQVGETVMSPINLLSTKEY